MDGEGGQFPIEMHIFIIIIIIIMVTDEVANRRVDAAKCPSLTPSPLLTAASLTPGIITMILSWEWERAVRRRRNGEE